MVDGASYGSPVPLSADSGTINAANLTLGTHTLSAVYSATGNFANGDSFAAAISQSVVLPHLGISVPTNVSSGIPFNLTVTALDLLNNTDPGYNGPFHFTSSDGQAILPADA